jgi:chaperonin cofactor prefoldin|tara:strand:- start:767 stop:1054 length:288 start_codon:yes stop_codon:yes gene_type:complete
MKKQSAFTLRSGNKPSIAKVAGVSPVKADETVGLSPEEKEKGTQITGGNKQEVIIDLQDRIEFLESDIENETKAMKKGKMISQVKKLKKKLKQLM